MDMVKIFNKIVKGWTAEHKFNPDRKFRFDWANPKVKIAIECDGGVWIRGRHSGGIGQIKDMEKFNIATLMGWRVLKYTPSNLMQACEDIKILLAREEIT